ncbi:MAG TPA: hypothetical protein DCW68_07075 [Rhodospirillaceae bacterium]|nr:hypothetical protein [Rhodospirillaceae bacterium]
MPLADVSFTDLYLSPTGETPFMKEHTSGPLVPVLEEMREEAIHLARSLPGRGGERREFAVSWGGVTYRVARIEAVDGIWYTLRRGPRHVLSIYDIGLHPALVRELIELNRKSGLFIICGKTGEGKSWTAASILQSWLESFGDVAVTIEDPPELPLNGWKGSGRCFQMMVPENEFGAALVGAMRYTPRYILLGEIRSKAAAREALRASVNGHAVITTMHAGSIQEALHRLLDLGGGEEADGHKWVQGVLAEGLSGVLHQHLIADGDKRRLEARFLFCGPGAGDPARALIREGKIEQLGTLIEAQSARLLRSTPT